MRILIIFFAVLIAISGCPKLGSSGKNQKPEKPKLPEETEKPAEEVSRCQYMLELIEKEHVTISTENIANCKMILSNYSTMHPENTVISKQVNLFTNILNAASKPLPKPIPPAYQPVDLAKQNLAAFNNYVRYSLSKQQSGSLYYVYDKNNDISQKWLHDGFDLLTRGRGIKRQ